MGKKIHCDNCGSFAHVAEYCPYESKWMADFSKKLDEIFTKGTDALTRAAMTRQALVDSGWVKTITINDRTIVLNGKDPLGYVVYYPNESLTGQEWFDRFESRINELFRFASWPEHKVERVEAWEKAKIAAMHAAGLARGINEQANV